MRASLWAPVQPPWEAPQGPGTVILSSNSSWAVTSNAPWLTPASASGTGSALIGFTYTANPNATAQTGTLTIGGLPFVVTQAGNTSTQILPVTSLVGTTLNHPLGVSVDASGNVYIADTSNNVVKEWNATTLALTTPVATGLTAPASVAVDSHGNIYISDSGDKAIKEWNTQQLVTLVATGLGNPRGIAVDSMGDVFIADSQANSVLEFTAATGLTTVMSGLNAPTAVAVDLQGNVYVADTGNNAIKRWSALNGQVTTIVSTGLSGPSGIAVDGQGNVDFADTGNNQIKQWNAATQVVSVLAGTGLSGPVGVAAGSQGSVYLADTNNSAVKEVSIGYLQLGSNTRSEGAGSGTDVVSAQVLPAGTPLSATSDATWLTVTTVAGGSVNFSFLANPSVTARVAHIAVVSPQVTVTQNGDVPAALTQAAGAGQSAPTGTAFPTALAVTVVDAAGLPVQGASVTFSTTAGATGANGSFASSLPVVTDQNGRATASTLTANPIGGSFTATASVPGAGSASFPETNLTSSLGGSSVSVGSAAGSNSVELVTSTSWTATSNASWLTLVSSSGTSGGVVLFNYTANTGTGSRTATITFAGSSFGTLVFAVSQAGTSYTAISLNTSFITSGLNHPESVALDPQGNVYIADTNDNDIKEWVMSTGAVTCLVCTGLNTPYGIAVGQGNVYFTDSKNNDVKEWVPPLPGTLKVLVSSGLSVPFGVALDGQGNVYFSDTGHNSIKEYIPTTGAVNTLVSAGLSGPRGVAVDALGNVYFIDAGNNAVKEYTPSTGKVSTLVNTGLNLPSGVAVDGEGNVYIADTNNGAIKRWSPSTNVVTTLISKGLNGPGGVALDTQGNVYIADTNDGYIDKLLLAWLSLGASARTEGPLAGSDSVSVQVLPATTALVATSDATWLTIKGTSGGLISFSFTTNTSVTSRVAHITILGQVLTITQNVDVPATITKIAGNSQSVAVNTTYPINLEVQVNDSAGNGVEGASVTFTTTAGSKGSNGTFTSTTAVITTSTGTATASALKANGVAGTFTATATVSGLTTVFTLTITAH